MAGRRRPALGQEPPAGIVERVQGSALAVLNADVRPLAPGVEIFIGDILSTGAGSRLEIRMRDDAIFVLGEQAAFVVVDYTFGGAGKPRAVMRLLQGAFLATSGAIGQIADVTMVVETPVATIGIRGTTVWGGPLDDAFRIVMLEGTSISVENAGGRVDLTEAWLGTGIAAPGAAPAAPGPWGDDRLSRAIATVAFTQP